MKRQLEKSVRPQDGRRLLPVSAFLLFLLSLPTISCKWSSAARLDPPAGKVSRAAGALGDSDGDGLPDGAELRTADDRENFRRWFAAIAEAQFYEVSPGWSIEQQDCAGLVRFAWRESLRSHDRGWIKSIGGFTEPVAPDVRGLQLEAGLLGEKLFRTKFGQFRETDLTDGTFSEFADARTLKNYNVNFVSRDRRQAQTGDLLFYHQPWTQRFPFHVMVFLGEARNAPEGAHDWVVYHTGSGVAFGARAHEEAPPASAADRVTPSGGTTEHDTIKKVRLSVLDQHPNVRWRPLPGNANFLGFYRLKILD
ncbi:MAG: DUF1175 family protein [Acidobacteriota bacterium]